MNWAGQTKSQVLAPLQTAVAPVGALGQGAHKVPQLFTLVSSTHCPPQSWNPGLHVDPQLAPSHVGFAFAGGWQGAQRTPQESVELLSEQPPEQSWNPPWHW
jgi:hypothetical protein